jgi:hypothetical protein
VEARAHREIADLVELLHVVIAVIVGMPDVDDGARQRTSVDGRDRSMGPEMSEPMSFSGAAWTKNGPSTVVSVAPSGTGWLIASTSMETPSVSDSRMNSWRLSSHMWPVRVRNSMPYSHSFWVGRTSRTKA